MFRLLRIMMVSDSYSVTIDVADCGDHAESRRCESSDDESFLTYYSFLSYITKLLRISIQF